MGCDIESKYKIVKSSLLYSLKFTQNPIATGEPEEPSYQNIPHLFNSGLPALL